MTTKTKYVIYILNSSGKDGYFISLHRERRLGFYDIKISNSTRMAKWFDTEESAKFMLKQIENPDGYYMEIRPIQVECD